MTRDEQARRSLARFLQANGRASKTVSRVRDAEDVMLHMPAREVIAAMLKFAALTPERVEIPAGMKPWAGGDSAPADWDGRNCLTRAGDLVIPLSCARWIHTGAAFEIVAYSPATPAEQTEGRDRG